MTEKIYASDQYVDPNMDQNTYVYMLNFDPMVKGNLFLLTIEDVENMISDELNPVVQDDVEVLKQAQPGVHVDVRINESLNDPYDYDEDEELPERTPRTITMWKLTEDELEMQRELVRYQQEEDALNKQIENLAGDLIRKKSRINREKREFERKNI